MILGQAWLAGPNVLATCGHVVESLAQTPNSLLVKFPSSGNRYPVKSVKLHPSYIRQKDGLVRFDAAVLSVDLAFSEKTAKPLPIAFDKPPTTSKQLASVRFPTHLGNLTSAPSPLTQVGALLGLLRKHDNFHLLHDLALAPGDSGAAIFDGQTVVAIHCGDTATLPGLGVSTTAIRLALWIDALRELDVQENASNSSLLKYQSGKDKVLTALSSKIALLVALIVGILLPLAVSYFQSPLQIKQPALLPVTVTFDKPLKNYKAEDNCTITIKPGSNCNTYLFDVTDIIKPYHRQYVAMLFPPIVQNGYSPYVTAGDAQTISKFGKNNTLPVSRRKGDLHLVVLKPDAPNLMTESDFAQVEPESSALTITWDDIAKRIQDIRSTDPSAVLDYVMEAPSAN